ncbi:hypothetical protein KY289_030565 [Solanum tuberosum]|nr:hypothetical protein KY289_030565 [Solanum tuberosum]
MHGRICILKCGGLNIKGCKKWNEASVGKLLWHVSGKQDILWVKWVHELYIKHGRIWEYTPPVDCSWYWRKLNGLKMGMQGWYQNGRYMLTQSGMYSVTQNYNDLYLDHREDWQKLISFGQEKCSRNRDLLSDWLTKIGYSPRQTNQAKHSGKKSSMWTVFQGSTRDPDFIFR